MAGGFNETYKITTSAEIYNIAGNSWRSVTGLPSPSLGSLFAYENTIWAAGTQENEIYRYDYSQDEWTHMPGIKMPGLALGSDILVDTDDTLKCSLP